jgi:hypothetical protein
MFNSMKTLSIDNFGRLLQYKVVIVGAAITTGLLAQTPPPAEHKAPTGYTDTPYIPGSKWRVHDDTRPRPPVVTPGTFSTPEVPGKPPSDAVVLFDGTNLDAWRTAKGEPAKWKVENGYFEVAPGTGDIFTRQEFGDSQLHIEWRAPSPPKGDSQGRGNSGIFLMGLYETQVLDCYDNKTYADGQTGSIYGQSPPLVNPCRQPGEWQQYDIVYTTPHFKDGKLDVPGYVTTFLNGVIVQNHTQLLGATGHRVVPALVVHGLTNPIRLQDHRNPVRYRNVWIRPLGEVQ